MVVKNKRDIFKLVSDSSDDETQLNDEGEDEHLPLCGPERVTSHREVGSSALRRRNAPTLTEATDKYGKTKKGTRGSTHVDTDDEHYDPSLAACLYEDYNYPEDGEDSDEGWPMPGEHEEDDSYLEVFPEEPSQKVKMANEKWNKCSEKADKKCKKSDVKSLSKKNKALKKSGSSKIDKKITSQQKSKKRVSFHCSDEEDERPTKKTKFDFSEDENSSDNETENSDDDLTNLNRAKITDQVDMNSSINSDEDESNMPADSEEDIESDEDALNAGSRSVKMLPSVNASETSSKSAAIKQQMELYGRLFASRIALQRAVTAGHRLPPPAYAALPAPARPARAGAVQAAAALLQACRLLQQAVDARLPQEGRRLLAGQGQATKKPTNDDDDEEITSSEDEGPATNTPATANPPHLKGLRDTEAWLAQRHSAMAPYRDCVMEYWHKRAQLLRGPGAKAAKGAKGGFGAFEEGFAAGLERTLRDRNKLLETSQLRTFHRGTLEPPIGGRLGKERAPGSHEYVDPEVYDDRDFYARGLARLLETQRCQGSLDSREHLTRLDEIRQQTKKYVKKSGRGRKMDYTVVPSMVNFLAQPRGEPEMQDAAFLATLLKPAGAST